MSDILDEPRVTPFERLGGRATIHAIVERFYDLMEGDPAYAELRAMHAPDLGPMRHSLTGFLTAWCGGPQDWHRENPGKCMMSAHAGFAMDSTTAGQWAEAMQRAITDVAPEDEEMAWLLADRLDKIARAMGRMAETPPEQASA